MIFNQEPKDWKDLQDKVKIIFDDIGYEATTEKTMELVRGKKEIDVFAVNNSKPQMTIIVECKLYNSRVSQDVVHSFSTVVQGCGANIGIIVSKLGFQKGCYEAVEKTNILLFNWEEFQNHFLEIWIEHSEKKLRDKATQLGEITDLFHGIDELRNRFSPIYYWSKMTNLSNLSFPFSMKIPRHKKNDRTIYEFSSLKDHEKKVLLLIEQGVKRGEECRKLLKM